MTPFEDLSLLRVFIRIVEGGNISAAARTLKIPQPTMSRYLRTLEERAGTTLLQRDTHRMRLTAAGHRFLESARSILELADDGVQRLKDDQSLLSGHLRLFATIDLGQTAVTRLIARFLHDNPGVTAELSYSNRPVQMLEQGFDAGVVAGEITDEGVIARSAAPIARYLVASPEFVRRHGAPKDPADLKSLPWASLSGQQFSGGNQTVLLMQRLADKPMMKTLRVDPILLSEGVTSLRQAVLAGLAIAVLPDWLIREDVATGQLVRVLRKWSAPDLPLNVIYQADRNLPRRVRAFIEAAVTGMTAEIGVQIGAKLTSLLDTQALGGEEQAIKRGIRTTKRKRAP